MPLNVRNELNVVRLLPYALPHFGQVIASGKNLHPQFEHRKVLLTSFIIV
jgi:hypothetical protein